MSAKGTRPLTYLGKACHRGHVDKNGKTRRRRSNRCCLICDNSSNKEARPERAAQRAGRARATKERRKASIEAAALKLFNRWKAAEQERMAAAQKAAVAERLEYCRQHREEMARRNGWLMKVAAWIKGQVLQPVLDKEYEVEEARRAEFGDLDLAAANTDATSLMLMMIRRPE